MNARRLRILGAMMALLTGCVDSVGGLDSAANDPLAVTFEDMARQANGSGDAARAMGFSIAAVAAKSGIAPGQLVLSNAGVSETYEGFVTAITWQLSGTAAVLPNHRSLVAWRRGSDGVIRMLHLASPSDSAPILHPLSMSPSAPIGAMFAGSNGLYQEVPANSLTTSGTYAGKLWVATTGYVKMRETLTGSACPTSSSGPAPAGVTCQQSRFAVQFEVSFDEASVPPYQLKAAGATRRITAGSQSLPGFKLTFTCAVPRSTGC